MNKQTGQAMTDLKTPEQLLSALRAASSRKPTPEELLKQRISFIMSALSEHSSVTRAQVTEILAHQEGRKIA